ncbi:WYL domain-containing protein [uncultured Desulfobacter sp.]|uniref:WYL domain-containing protein n=1 Tax=uncultured Desulfobacter sp. TaxID=240139 RepID=UPI002AAB8AB8|nr:WYL domain-containing protein [uncultured Desulfobacter sp.]
MKWGIKQRLEFIEFRLFWEGTINRKDLTDTFGVSVPQASADIKQYKQTAPGNIYYDKRQKKYLVSSKFEPVLGLVDAHKYLSTLSMLSEGVIRPDETFLGYIPEFSVVPSFERTIDPYILKRIVRALKEGKAINIQYQSMSRPSPVWRWISPHAFAFDGYRWHVRAYCELAENFRDFILGRIIDIQHVKTSKVNSADDHKWNHLVTLKIGAHPELTPDQRKIIEKEYRMENGVAQIKVRAVFIYYVLLRFNLEQRNDLTVLKNREAILLNYNEIKKYI